LDERLIGWSVGQLDGLLVCWMVGWSVGQLVGWMVIWLVGWSVGWLIGILLSPPTKHQKPLEA